MSTMPLTISRPKAAILLGISLDAVTKKTESGEFPVEWQGKRRKIPAGVIARAGQITVAELADRWAAFFPDDIVPPRSDAA